MFKLLLLRAVPLFLRPAAVLLEGVVIAENHFLVIVLPIAMMALTTSSIPVHLDYFKSLPGSLSYDRLAKQYISALTWLTLVSILVLVAIFIFFPFGLGELLFFAICLVFLTEKIADEASRILEFRKDFVSWFFVQAFRSGWFFIPIIASVFGFSYEVAFLMIAALICIFMYYVFRRVSGLVPCFEREGLAQICDNLVFLIGSFLPSSYRQMPRIVVAKLYPEQAHIFLAMAQVAQGVGLIFNVRYQIPYRKVIARRTIIFQRLMQPTMLRVLMPSGLIALAYFMIPYFVAQESLSNNILALLLAPVMIADALTFSILAAHLGYLPWFVKKNIALTCYILCIGAAVLVGALFSSVVVGHVSLLSVPSLTMIVGFIWLLLIKVQFFSGKVRHAWF